MKLQHLKISQIEKVMSLCKVFKGVQVTTFPSKEADKLVKDMLSGKFSAPGTLVHYLNSLNKQQLNELSAVMLYGRDWDGSFEEALEHCEAFSKDDAVLYIYGKENRLPGYLKNGLNKLDIRPA